MEGGMERRREVKIIFSIIFIFYKYSGNKKILGSEGGLVLENRDPSHGFRDFRAFKMWYLHYSALL